MPPYVRLNNTSRSFTEYEKHNFLKKWCTYSVFQLLSASGSMLEWLLTCPLFETQKKGKRPDMKMPARKGVRNSLWFSMHSRWSVFFYPRPVKINKTNKNILYNPGRIKESCKAIHCLHKHPKTPTCRQETPDLGLKPSPSEGGGAVTVEKALLRPRAILGAVQITSSQCWYRPNCMVELINVDGT